MLEGLKFYLTSPQSPVFVKLARMSYSASKRTRLYRKLSKLMQNGKQLQSSVEDLQKRAMRNSRLETEAIALSEILGELRAGNSFSAAVQNYVTTNERMILEAGEQSGGLTDALDLAAEILDASKKMKNQVFGAMVQPALLLAMMLFVIFAVSKWVMPKLTSVLAPSKWKPGAEWLYHFSQFVNSPWFIGILVLLLILLAGIGFSLALWTGRGRAKFDQIPPWSMFRLLVGSGWILSLASQVRSGETVLDSLKNMRDVSRQGRFGNRWLYDRLNRTIFYFTSGLNLGEALEATGTNFPDREIVDDLVTYSDLEGFDETLYSLGREWVESGQEKIKQQASVLNTSATVLIGLILGWFTYAVVSIQMSLGTHFSGMGGF